MDSKLRLKLIDIAELAEQAVRESLRAAMREVPNAYREVMINAHPTIAKIKAALAELQKL